MSTYDENKGSPVLKEHPDFALNFPPQSPVVTELLTQYGDIRRNAREIIAHDELCGDDVMQYLILTCRWVHWLDSRKIESTARPLLFTHAKKVSNCPYFELINRTHDAGAAFLAWATREESSGREMPAKRRTELVEQARRLIGLLQFVHRHAFPKWRDAPPHKEPYDRSYNRELYNWCRAYVLWNQANLSSPDSDPDPYSTEEVLSPTYTAKAVRKQSADELARTQLLFTARTILASCEPFLKICRPDIKYGPNAEVLRNKCTSALVEAKSASSYGLSKQPSKLLWSEKLHTEFLFSAAKYFSILEEYGKGVCCLDLAGRLGREVPQLDRMRQENISVHSQVVPDADGLLNTMGNVWQLESRFTVQNGLDPLANPEDGRTFV